MFSFDIATLARSISQVEPLMMLAVILVAGLVGERVAQRLRCPGITGNLAAGILIGPACLNLFSGQDPVAQFAPLSMFAMVFIALAVGSQLSYHRIHNALSRILAIAVAESLAACGLVMIVAYLFTGDPWIALLLGSLAAATAPTTTLAIVRENRARGPFVKTLMAVVGIDCSLCILFFSLAQGWAAEHFSGSGFVGGHPVAHLAWQIVGSFALAGLIGKGMDLLVHRWRLSEFVAMFLAVLLVAGVSGMLGVNRLLVGLFLGVLLANFSSEHERYGRAFEPIELLLFTGFFTLAGVSLHWHSLVSAGLLCVVYLLARAGGKALGAFVGGVAVNCPSRILTNIPYSLFPQAGVAVGLVIVLQNDVRIPGEISQLIGVTVLAAVAINEIIGPFFTRAALRRTNEADRDVPRLMEFLQEEFIMTGLTATDKWEAINKAADFLFRTHRVPAAEREEIRASFIEREQALTTAIGYGIAIPHGRIATGADIQGVLAICPDGVDFGAADGEPVKILVLIVTPKEHERRHLEVLASLSRMLSDENLRLRLEAARHAHDVWEVIEDEEYRDYNYFLTESPAETAPSQ